MKNNLIKIFSVLVICIFAHTQAFAVGESNLPVSTSYSEAIQAAQNQITTTQNQTQKQAQTTEAEQTLAHQAVTGTLDTETTPEMQAAEQEVQAIKDEIKKQTKPRRSYVNVIFKFILAILWVCISSVIIFIILLSYKRLILKGKPITPTYESTEQSLDTPKNFKEAIKLFLDKTKWE